MAVQALECPGCGATLRPTPGQATVTCEYCRATSQVQPPPKSSPWNAHHAQVSANATRHAARARKVILWSSVGTAIVGIAMTGIMAAVGASDASTPPVVPPPVSPAMPSTPSLPSAPSPAAAMNPAMARAAALNGRLDAYVRSCMNRLDDRILSSRARYRSWVDDDEGPQASSRHIYGLYSFYDPSDCAEQAAAVAAIAPRDVEMDEAAQAYVAAVDDLHGVVAEAERYYDRNDYLDDDMARGKAMHGPLLDGFNRFIVAREALIAHVDRGFEEALTAAEEALPSSDTRGRLLYDTMRSALAIAREANVHWREVGSIDHDSFVARVEGYQRQVDQLEDNIGENDRTLQSYVQASQAFALAAKELGRRVDRGGGWSRGDRMMLDGVGSHWMVTGSPGAALGKYNDIADVRDITPPLRYIAPTALLSDGY